jgi:metal-responsive CopG/Arc/MetJ family transcriptional regulator
MRMAVDIPDDQLAELTRLAKREGMSRAALIRRAIADLLASRRKTENEAAFAAAFGIWADRDEDGLAYQERLRSEWEGRDER